VSKHLIITSSKTVSPLSLQENGIFTSSTTSSQAHRLRRGYTYTYSIKPSTGIITVCRREVGEVLNSLPQSSSWKHSETLVAAIPSGERNFHIFYYLIAGASPEERLHLHLLDKTMYRYLGPRGTTSTRPDEGRDDDGLRFDQLKIAQDNR
jgi:hypothetical protein